MAATSARDVVRQVAGFGLPGTDTSLPQAALDEATWAAVVCAAFRARVTGHLVRSVEDGSFTATDGQRAAALTTHEDALVRDVMLEQLLLTAVARLEAVGLRTRVLRGPSIAHLAYPDPGLRSFGDIDLLAAPGDYDAVVRTLCDAGARRRYLEPRPGFDRRFGKGVCLEMRNGLEIDLHRTFVAGPFGLAVDVDDVFSGAAHFSLGGRTVASLDDDSLFIDACFHAALGGDPPRLVPLRDVGQMALCRSLDVDRVRELCRRWRCGIVVQRAVDLTWDTFRIHALPDVVRWARSYEPSSFERHAIDSYTSADRSYSRQAVAGLRALDGLRARTAYAANLLIPRREYLRAHDGSYLRRAARGIRLLLADWSDGRGRRPAT